MILDTSPNSIAIAASLLAKGELVAFPTETVYGLGANPFISSAVEKIFKVKGRPSTNPLIVHLLGPEDLLRQKVAKISKEQGKKLELLKKFFPGPLTVVLPKSDALPDIVTGGNDAVAVRFPSHEVARNLIAECGFPLAAPSANRSNYVSPTTAAHVIEELGDQVAAVIDGGESTVGVESTVISLLSDPVKLLRPGAITVEELKNCLGAVDYSGMGSEAPKLSPGMLEKHYSPHTPLAFYGDIPTASYPKNVALVTIGQNSTASRAFDYSYLVSLSNSGDLNEAAHNLYRVLRELDQLKLDLILVERCPEVGIGLAIMDRLKRARSKC